ncbi:MAG: Gfo/Idh/MocA family oxidoreductase [Candidatus Hydrogenedentes bacterium]|nr:Gfo/Idh/MocA family oxidoreductase [Candidatus Hydrogenedentota bacterium]
MNSHGTTTPPRVSRSKRFSRRAFLRAAGAAAAAVSVPVIIPARALGLGRRIGPNDKITVGCIGVGPQGQYVMKNFMNNEQARVIAVCDVKNACCLEAKQQVDGFYKDANCVIHRDFRELTARDDIDVVSIASTDHWHVLHALSAVRAGKDVYVEKPLAVSIAELQATRDAVHKHGRLFQFGTQQRSSREFRFACELVRNRLIGDLHTIKVGAPPSIPSENFPEQPVPDGIDYEMWLGPAPYAPYNENRVSHDYWWHCSDYAIGFISGWGIHHIDIAQWGNDTDLTGPTEIAGTGVFPKDGMCDCALKWNIEAHYENGVRLDYTDDGQNPHGITFEGSEGWVYVKRGLIDAQPKSLLQYTLKPDEIHLYESTNHAGNLLDCVRTRAQTVCPIDVAARSDTICQISDMAIRAERPLRWDPATERFAGDDVANRALARAMREPWRL